MFYERKKESYRDDFWKEGRTIIEMVSRKGVELVGDWF
jgi:hypothetical protein